MSDLFMDMHRSRRRWHNHQNTPPTPSSTTTTTTTSDSPSSPQHVNEHKFSHHIKQSSAAGENAAHNVNYNFNNRKEDGNDKHDDDDAYDAIENTISLKLKKPKHWKWELSTSKSCSNIALPRILLYDHKGELLVDAHSNNEQVYKSEDQDKLKRDGSKKRSHHSTQRQSEYQQRSATVNLTHSIRQALEKEFNGLHIQEATPSPQPNSPISVSSRCSRKAIDFNTNDLPDNGLSRRTSSLKGVRFNIEDGDDPDFNGSNIPEFLPTPPSTTTPTSSSSGPRGKRKYRRSQSSGRSSAHSESILERFSFQKGRFSSPEFAEETEVQQGPRYFLQTCNAGTLVVKEDSFSQHPRRRRRTLKNRSTESLHSSSQHTQKLSVSKKSPTPGDISVNTKQQSINLAERNIFLNKQLSTSEEDLAVAAIQKPLVENVNGRHVHKYSRAQNQKQDVNYSTDIHQNGKVR